MEKKWETLNQKLRTKDSGYNEPNYPYKSDHLIKDFNELYSKIYDKEKFLNLWVNC